jgi:hypothetical protein
LVTVVTMSVNSFTAEQFISRSYSFFTYQIMSEISLVVIFGKVGFRVLVFDRFSQNIITHLLMNNFWITLKLNIKRHWIANWVVVESCLTRRTWSLKRSERRAKKTSESQIWTTTHAVSKQKDQGRKIITLRKKKSLKHLSGNIKEENIVKNTWLELLAGNKSYKTQIILCLKDWNHWVSVL